jgi:hypothetical protein
MFAAITRNEVRIEAVALLSMLFFFSLFVFEEEDSIFPAPSGQASAGARGRRERIFQYSLLYIYLYK